MVYFLDMQKCDELEVQREDKNSNKRKFLIRIVNLDLRVANLNPVVFSVLQVKLENSFI